MAQTTVKMRQIAGGLDGWIPAEQTWTYASADDPTYTFTVAADVTTKYSAGMKIKLTQGTVKYFIITAVSTYSGGNTTITVYGGTDYDLADSAISANAYSMMKSPQGFPMSPAKWSVATSVTTTISQGSPTSGTWYNITNISVPIGQWNTEYSAIVSANVTASYLLVWATLSTANNTAGSDTRLKCSSYINASLSIFRPYFFARSLLTCASKTTYYFNVMCNHAGSAAEIAVRGANGEEADIVATCAYL